MSTEVRCKYYSAIKERPVSWLWYPYIPYGKVTVLQGDPGEGKSTFMVNLAAALSHGVKLPDGSALDGPKTVLYQCAEDSNEDTIKPRLMQAGADCSRIAFIEDDDKSLTLDDDRIDSAIGATGAQLLVLDPIQAYIAQDGDMQSATKMRSTIRRLAEIAERHQCAVVLVGHMNKSKGGKNLYRGLGSIDIAAIARSVLMIVRDQANPDIRYMFPVKSSLAPEGQAIGFLFDPELGFRWIGRCSIRPEDADYRPPRMGKLDRAKDLLRLMLSSDDMASAEVFERMGQLGFSERTIKSAKKDLGVDTYRKGGAWYWKHITVTQMSDP